MPPPSNTFLATSVSSAGISEQWQSSPTDPSFIACPIRLALVGWDLTMPVLQAGSLATFSSRTSLLPSPRPASTSMHRFFFLFFYLGGEKEGNGTCTIVSLRRCVWDSSKACQWVYSPVGQSPLPIYLLKPSHAGEPSHIPLRKVDGRTRFKVEIGKPLIRPEGSVEISARAIIQAILSCLLGPASNT